MHLDTFSYYFSTTGKQGGLFSVDFKFIPFDATVTDRDEMKRATKTQFESLLATLDEILLHGDGIQCTREPTFVDSTGHSSGGYAYRGSVGGGLRLLASTMQTASASVKFSLSKLGGQKIGIEVSLQLTHEFNLVAMRAVLAQPALTISEEAQGHIDALQKLIAGGADTDAKIVNLLATGG